MASIACRLANVEDTCWGGIQRRGIPLDWVCEGHAPCLTLGGVFQRRPARPVRTSKHPVCEYGSGSEPCWGPIAVFDVRHASDGVLSERYVCMGHGDRPKRGGYVTAPVDHQPQGTDDAAWPF